MARCYSHLQHWRMCRRHGIDLQRSKLQRGRMLLAHTSRPSPYGRMAEQSACEIQVLRRKADCCSPSEPGII